MRELFFFYLKRERMRTKSKRMNLYITFYFFFRTKNKKRNVRVINKYNMRETYNGREKKSINFIIFNYLFIY